MTTPLDKRKVVVQSTSGKKETFEALHSRWKEDIHFVTYQSPPTKQSDKAQMEEWGDRLRFIEEDLHRLLQMPHDKFWCQIVFDESLHKLIDSYLRFAPRSYDVIFELTEETRNRHNEVHRLVFMVCLRTATYKESKEHHITPDVFGWILYENFLFDMPKLFDLCVLYGKDNAQLLNKMVDNIFTQQPLYNDDLRQVIPTILQVFTNIQDKCGLMRTDGDRSPQKLNTPRRDTVQLDEMSDTELQDIVFYLADIGITLSSFLEVYPPACHIFSSEEFVQRLAAIYDAVVPEVSAAIKRRSFDNNSYKHLLRQKISSAKKSLVKVVHNILSHCFVQPILENSQSAEEHIEGFIQLLSSVLNERRFLADFESCHSLQEFTEILTQSQCDIDETRVQYIQDAFNSAFATFGKRQKPTGATQRGGRTSPDGSPAPVEEAATGGAGYQPPDYQSESHHDQEGACAARNQHDQEGACAARKSGIELDSLISSVRDLLPDLGEGFIEGERKKNLMLLSNRGRFGLTALCLEEMEYNIERVINSVLEEKLPPSLQDIDRTMKREVKPKEDEVISSRANVYDHDEFDIFSNERVDTTRVFKGKRGKSDNITLDDKGPENIKLKLSETYGYQVEVVDGDDWSQMTELYDDEYDDTYDANNVGADDADSADELTNRRPFTVPRILGGKVERRQIEESESEESAEEKPRDEFIQNPAIIRQQREERAQWKAQRKGGQQVRGQPQGQEGQKKHDVKGGPKGQGQSNDVLRNRRWKEKHKSNTGNHNRKFMSDKKRMGFGAGPPK